LEGYRLMSSAIICERLHSASRQNDGVNAIIIVRVAMPSPFVLSTRTCLTRPWCVSDRYCGSNHPLSPRWSRREKRAGRQSRKSCEVQSTTLSLSTLPPVNVVNTSREEGCEVRAVSPLCNTSGFRERRKRFN